LIKNFDQLLEAAKSQRTMRLAVAAAQDPEVLGAVVKAAELGLIEPVLIGDRQKIAAICGEEHLEICGVEIIDEPELEAAAKVSVQMVRDGKADFLMKGLIDTSILLKAVLNREYGLRTDSQLSHVMLYDAPAYHKLLFLTDGGMNIEPTLAEKATILRNALDAARTLGMETVKVACIAAKEKVNEKMPATVDARALQNMSREGDFGEGVIVEGPLAFDLAVSREAAEIKGFESEVAGDADVLLVPNIEVGNGIGKALTYLANAESAGVIMGAKVPVVLVSRADTAEVKLYSIALGSIIAAGMNPNT
jgi:phosphate butyryltransferase